MGKIFALTFICENLFLRIAGKIAKIRTRKNFVLHGKPYVTLVTQGLRSSVPLQSNSPRSIHDFEGTPGGDVPPGSLDCDCISDQKKFIFKTCFQTCPLDRHHVIIT